MVGKGISRAKDLKDRYMTVQTIIQYIPKKVANTYSRFLYLLAHKKIKKKVMFLSLK